MVRVNPHHVKVGHMYKDNDRRVLSRTLSVVDIEGEYAVCKATTPNGGVKTVRVLLRRFRPNSRGYKKVT